MLLLRQRDWAKRAMRALSKGGPLRNVRTLVTRDEPLQLSKDERLGQLLQRLQVHNSRHYFQVLTNKGQPSEYERLME